MSVCLPKIRVESLSPSGDANLVPLSLPLAGETHVWRAITHVQEDDLRRFKRLLSNDEKERAERFRFERDRNQYIVSRGLLRQIIAAYRHILPAEVRFRYSPKGKPELLSPSASGLEFNIAHSGEMILLAFSSDRRIGVDIEKLRPDVEIDDLAERFFSLSERNCLAALPLAQRYRAFFRCWARKEAVLKATGEGLSVSLDSFDVLCSVAEDSYYLSLAGQGDWQIQDLAVAPGYAAAVALEQAPDLNRRMSQAQ